MGVSRIALTIDRLVLRGFDADDRKALVEGLQSELSHVLADYGQRTKWARSHRTPVLRLGGMPLESDLAGARKLGRGVAAAIGKGLKP